MKHSSRPSVCKTDGCDDPVVRDGVCSGCLDTLRRHAFELYMESLHCSTWGYVFSVHRSEDRDKAYAWFRRAILGVESKLEEVL